MSAVEAVPRGLAFVENVFASFYPLAHAHTLAHPREESLTTSFPPDIRTRLRVDVEYSCRRRREARAPATLHPSLDPPRSEAHKKKQKIKKTNGGGCLSQ